MCATFALPNSIAAESGRGPGLRLWHLFLRVHNPEDAEQQGGLKK